MGNSIGTDASGFVALGNGKGIEGGGFTVGGPTPEMANTISGNTSQGIFVGSISFTPATIQGNRIGVASDGVTPLGNLTNGIQLTAQGCLVGGTDPGEGNVIANSGDYAVQTNNHFGNSILGNSIYNTAGAPAILNQVFLPRPTFISAASNESQIRIAGSFSFGTANGVHRIEFFSNPACDSSGSGAGPFFRLYQRQRSPRHGRFISRGGDPRPSLWRRLRIGLYFQVVRRKPLTRLT